MELTIDQLDALKEIINIGVGRAASMMNDMVEARIVLNVPEIKLLPLSELWKEGQFRELDSDKLSAVQLGFAGSFSGTAALIFPTDSVSKLVNTLTGEDPNDDDLDSVRVGTLTEVGNVVLNGVMGSLGNVLEDVLDYAVPTYVEDTIANLVNVQEGPKDAMVLLAQTRFSIEQLDVDGEVMMFFEVGSFDKLMESIDRLTTE